MASGVPSDCTTPVPREILKVGERQYSVRVGNGADPPVLLLDGTEPGCIAIQFNIMDEVRTCTYYIVGWGWNRARLHCYTVQHHG